MTQRVLRQNTITGIAESSKPSTSGGKADRSAKVSASLAAKLEAAPSVAINLL